MSHDRPIGLFSATTLVAASMIGVGVYTTSGYTLDALGSPLLVIAAWGVAGAIAICGAIGYACLATQFAESGGEYLFLARTLHPVAGLMAGLVSLLAGFTGAIAIAALGLETYLQPIIAVKLPPGTIAIGFVLLAAGLHSIGVGRATRVQNVVVVVKLMMIGAIVIVSLWSLGSWPSTPAEPLVAASPWNFATQLVWISFSYAGFNAAVYVADEVQQPRRNVPRAMIGGTMLVTLIYLVLNTIFMYSASPATIVAPDRMGQVAATSAMALGGAAFEWFVRLVIAISLASSVSALVMSGPRVYAKMAADGLFPVCFRVVDRPPLVAIWFQAIFAIVVISVTTLQQLLGYLGLTLAVCSALTVSTLFLMRYRKQIDRLPGGGVPIVFYVVATLGLAVMYAIEKPLQTVAVALTISAGLAVYPFVKRRSTPLSIAREKSA
jgi:APA family basic amino acid/polyamine antiporter